MSVTSMILTLLVTAAAAGETPSASSPGSSGSGTLIVENALVRVIRQVEIPARKEGLLLEVQVKEGDIVKVDDLLGTIDHEQAELALRQSELELQLATEKARSEVAVNAARRAREFADMEFQRAERARQSYLGSISDAEYERLKMEVDKAGYDHQKAVEEQRFLESTRKAREVEVQLKKLEVSERKVTAPLEGIVTQVYHPPGEWVQPGQQMFHVLQIDRLRVEGYVSLDVAGTLAVKTPVTFVASSRAFAQDVYRGEIVFVNPESDPINHQVRIRGRLSLAPAIPQTATAPTETPK
jgi:multidrug resistance efflux pump